MLSSPLFLFIVSKQKGRNLNINILVTFLWISQWLKIFLPFFNNAMWRIYLMNLFHRSILPDEPINFTHIQSILNCGKNTYDEINLLSTFFDKYYNLLFSSNEHLPWAFFFFWAEKDFNFSSFFNIFIGVNCLQWCVDFCFITKWISYTYTYIPISPPSCVSLPPSLSHPSRWSQSTELISPCDAATTH